MFRMSQYAALSAAFLLALYFLSPAQLPVVLWKAGLLSFAGFIGYWLDRHLFPYARPHIYFVPENRSWAMIRRTIIVAAVIIGFALGV